VVIHLSTWIVRAFLGSAFFAISAGCLHAQAPALDSPLSNGEKWDFATAETFNPLIILDLGAAAAVRQEQNQFPSFGQWVRGYLKRFGVAFGNHVGSDYLTGAIFPLLLHEDPRYFRKASGGFFHRLFYAASRIPVTRTDAGTNRFNFSEFLGNAAAATLSNAYLPHGDRTTSYSAQTFGLFLASDALTNVAYEFWPDVRRKLFHHSSSAGGNSTSPAGLTH
jgi:hypothetical protein